MSLYWNIFFLFVGFMIHLFPNAAHQHEPLQERLPLIWKRCDLKGPCLCILLQLRRRRDINLTVKKHPCLNNGSALKIRHLLLQKPFKQNCRARLYIFIYSLVCFKWETRILSAKAVCNHIYDYFKQSLLDVSHFQNLKRQDKSDLAVKLLNGALWCVSGLL